MELVDEICLAGCGARIVHLGMRVDMRIGVQMEEVPLNSCMHQIRIYQPVDPTHQHQPQAYHQQTQP